MRKYDGRERRLLTPSEVRQIAGRAGRFGTVYSSGEVTTLLSEDLPHLHGLLDAPAESMDTAGLMPTVEQARASARGCPQPRSPPPPPPPWLRARR
jgi:ATP-dependent RNA helicase SUPV3L1/SUV3